MSEFITLNTICDFIEKRLYERITSFIDNLANKQSIATEIESLMEYKYHYKGYDKEQFLASINMNSFFSTKILSIRKLWIIFLRNV